MTITVKGRRKFLKTGQTGRTSSKPIFLIICVYSAAVRRMTPSHVGEL